MINAQGASVGYFLTIKGTDKLKQVIKKREKTGDKGDQSEHLKIVRGG